MGHKQKIAEAILAMTYAELMEFAGELVGMQETLKEDTGGESAWKPTELYGEDGLPVMLASWAQGCEDEEA